jgi:hypothetical protein
MQRAGTLPIKLNSLAVGLSAALLTFPSACIARSGSVRAHASFAGGAISVTSCADDGGPGTLRAAVSSAASGDTVDLTNLTCATITLVSGQIEVHVDDLTVNGPGDGALAIDGNYNGRVFHHDGIGTLALSGLTITHGIADSADLNPDSSRAAYGGCILSDHGSNSTGTSFYGSVSLTNVTLAGCEAIAAPQGIAYFVASGGGVHAQADLTVVHSTISGNRASSANFRALGGGLYSHYGTISLTDSSVVDNRVEAFYPVVAYVPNSAGGGGLATYHGVVISGSIVAHNFAGCDSRTQFCHAAFGGGMRVSGALEISTSAIYDNTAEAQGSLQDAIANGAGCYSIYGDIHITDSTISDNHLRGNAAERRGGGLFLVGGLAPDEDVVIAGSTLDNNSADKGGGLFDKAGKLNIVDSTISGNTANTAGGAIYALGSTYGVHAWKLSSSTVTRNSAGSGGGIVDNHDPDLGPSELQSSIVAENINLAEAAYDADIGSVYSGVTIVGANNLIVAANGITLPPDTLDAAPLLGPLQDNGGRTRTHALLGGSPAIDTGNNAANLDFDQRGDGFVRIVGVSADIGAFEVQANDVVFEDGFDLAGRDGPARESDR